jgi:hypothetical protein
LRANTIDEAKTLFCKATGTALDFAACSLSSSVGFWPEERSFPPVIEIGDS